jgi:poly-gamma-glutamate synthesis protein (capsule biosynthesis protein)
MTTGPAPRSDSDDTATVFLCGDVMTGRGIDQILEHPGDPRLFEDYVTDAGEYVTLAEAASGPIPRRVGATYIWGDALAELARRQPQARIANLETSITRRGAPWPGKGIHYRMHPDNVACLTAAGLDVCVLANNHALDFGVDGLLDTIDVLAANGIRTAGAGRTLDEARAPAVVPLPANSRLLVFAFGMPSSGVPTTWRARADRPGLDVVDELSEAEAAHITARIRATRGPRDVVLVSVHWGSNWGYDVPHAQQRFAHWLVDGGVDVVYGHSSHHPRPAEVYRDRLILYGCGDLVNDYEGIAGYEQYRDDLALMYFATLTVHTGALADLAMVPMQIRAMRLTSASAADTRWLRDRLASAGVPFGTGVEVDGGRLTLRTVPTRRRASTGLDAIGPDQDAWRTDTRF